MMTLTTILAIFLTLQNNSGSLPVMPKPTHKLAEYLSIESVATLHQRYQKRDAQNSYYCQQLRDSIYADSEFLKQSNYQYPRDFMILSPHEARQNIQFSLARFNKNECYDDATIPRIDRDLIKKLETDLSK